MKKIAILLLSLFVFCINVNALDLDMQNQQDVCTKYDQDDMFNIIKFIDSNGDEKYLACNIIEGTKTKYGDSIKYEAGINGYSKITLNNFNGQAIIVERAQTEQVVIEVNGENTLDISSKADANYVIKASSNDLKFTGDGTLSLKIQSDAESNAIIASSINFAMGSNGLVNIESGIGCNSDAGVANYGIKSNGYIIINSNVNVNLVRGKENCVSGETRNVGYAIYGESDASNRYNEVTMASSFLINNGTLNINTAGYGIYWKGLNSTLNDVLFTKNANLNIKYEVIDNQLDNKVIHFDNTKFISMGKILIGTILTTVEKPVVDTELKNAVLINEGSIEFYNFTIQANAKESLISSTEILNLGDDCEVDMDSCNYSYYEFNNINTSGVLFDLKNNNLVVNKLASSDNTFYNIGNTKNLTQDEINFIDAEKTTKRNEITFVSGTNKIVNENDSRYYLELEYYMPVDSKLEVTELDSKYIDELYMDFTLPLNNYDIFDAKIIKLKKPDYASEDEFNLIFNVGDIYLSNKVYIDVSNAGRETFQGFVYTLKDGKFVAEYDKYTEHLDINDTSKKIYFTLHDVSLVNDGSVFILSDPNQIKSLSSGFVKIISSVAFDKSFKFDKGSFNDDFINKVKNNMLQRKYEYLDMYQFSLESNDDSVLLPDAVYTIRISRPTAMIEGEYLKIFEVNPDGTLTDRNIPYKVEGEYLYFDITKEDLENKTIFATGVSDATYGFEVGDFYLSSPAPVPEVCEFKIHDNPTFDGNTVLRSLKFELSCPEDVILPEGDYNVYMVKPYSLDDNYELSKNNQSISMSITSFSGDHRKWLRWTMQNTDLGQSDYLLKYLDCNEDLKVTKAQIDLYELDYSTVYKTITIDYPIVSGKELPSGPEISGKKFIGWTESHSYSILTNTIDIPSELFENLDQDRDDVYGCLSGALEPINLYPVYEDVEPITKYTVTFNSNGGTAVNTQTVESGKLATKPENPTKSGYTFKTWQLNGEDYDFNTPVTKDITLTAVWEKDSGAEDPGYNITKYSVDENNKYIFNIDVNTTLDDFKSNIKLSAGYRVEVDYKTIDGKNIVNTGGKTKIYKNQELVVEYTNIVRGDVNGDGKISSADYVKIRKHIMGTEVLNGIYFIAANVKYDETVSSADYVAIRKYIMNGEGL